MAFSYLCAITRVDQTGSTTHLDIHLFIIYFNTWNMIISQVLRFIIKKANRSSQKSAKRLTPQCFHIISLQFGQNIPELKQKQNIREKQNKQKSKPSHCGVKRHANGTRKTH